MTKNAEGLVDVGRLILTFAKINRVTLHEDGKRPESDTDHTVMTSVCACALADRLYKDDLDIGLVAQFSLVHDLVEAYADDTDSFGISEKDRAKKEEREHEAFLRIQKEFTDTYPWLPSTIERYETLDTKEARFVKTVDKCMTKITHLLNNGAYFRKRGLRCEEMWSRYQRMADVTASQYGKEFPEVLALTEELMTEVRIQVYGE